MLPNFARLALLQDETGMIRPADHPDAPDLPIPDPQRPAHEPQQWRDNDPTLPGMDPDMLANIIASGKTVNEMCAAARNLCGAGTLCDEEVWEQLCARLSLTNKAHRDLILRLHVQRTSGMSNVSLTGTWRDGFRLMCKALSGGGRASAIWLDFSRNGWSSRNKDVFLYEYKEDFLAISERHDERERMHEKRALLTYSMPLVDLLEKCWGASADRGREFLDLDDKILTAIDADNYNGVRELIRAGADINRPIHTPVQKWSPLIYAVRKGSIKMVKYLLLHTEADVNVINYQSFNHPINVTALHMSLTRPAPISVEMVRLLLDNGAKLDKFTAQTHGFLLRMFNDYETVDSSALTWFSKNYPAWGEQPVSAATRLQIAKLLIEKTPPDLLMIPLQEVLNNGDHEASPDLVKLYLENGAVVDDMHLQTAVNGDNYRLAILKLLLDVEGVRVTTSTAPRPIAALMENIPISYPGDDMMVGVEMSDANRDRVTGVKLIIEHPSFQPNALFRYDWPGGYTDIGALEVAIDYDQLGFVKLLLEKGARPAPTFTPLGWLDYEGTYADEIASLLLTGEKLQYDPNAKDHKDRLTPLHKAIDAKNPQIVEMLLRRREVNPNIARWADPPVVELMVDKLNQTWDRETDQDVVAMVEHFLEAEEKSPGRINFRVGKSHEETTPFMGLVSALKMDPLTVDYAMEGALAIEAAHPGTFGINMTDNDNNTPLKKLLSGFITDKPEEVPAFQKQIIEMLELPHLNVDHPKMIPLVLATRLAARRDIKQEWSNVLAVMLARDDVRVDRTTGTGDSIIHSALRGLLPSQHGRNADSALQTLALLLAHKNINVNMENAEGQTPLEWLRANAYFIRTQFASIDVKPFENLLLNAGAKVRSSRGRLVGPSKRWSG